MVKNKDNGTTNEDLAGMISRGFQDMETRLVSKDEFSNRLGGLETRFSSLEKKVDKLDYQVSEVYDILKRFEENDILNLQKRVQILKKTVRALATNQSR
ncbi:MAG: hypothetical protein A3J46_01990 [Candidatus Yanofskybacteria bacterium RIFCSPHIGHO2_02_FULL_41_11]|uniref:Uncharacterized protein n=1 Tax=Candidatus Yanofskybacteria bacterium RIFCSPHIGHO2_02_FULL_41_11 TaxID=1802675 RepID=A0A1F8F813_9BACT|nr:MAG: hypothetical protein A3J46_01990 [Candidatus Yanofskybacteria bacterium RIFCSPHIGHO2_02_FULL_41_11]